MMNIQTAIRQMRIARKLGKLSQDQQNRVMRRINPRSSVLLWERMNALRAQIDAEIAPKLQEKMEAEHKSYQIKYQPDPVMPTETTPFALNDRLCFLKLELQAKHSH